LTEKQRNDVSKELGSFIDVIPNKTEKGLMISFTEGNTMFNKGQKVDNCVFVDVRLYNTAGFAAKKEFTEKVFDLVTRHLGTRTEDIYVTLMEYGTWGTMGSLK
jgi:phenylpyruvate tautomerase PptA (4-oxalocrotonate tautomerase family)